MFNVSRELQMSTRFPDLEITGSYDKNVVLIIKLPICCGRYKIGEIYKIRVCLVCV